MYLTGVVTVCGCDHVREELGVVSSAQAGGTALCVPLAGLPCNCLKLNFIAV